MHTRSLRQVLARVALTILGLLAWFWTQSLIGQHAVPSGAIGDRVLAFLAPINDMLQANPACADALLTTSTLVIDALGVFILVRGVFGPSVAPLLGMFMLFGLRQICQALVSLPLPAGKIWRDPGLLPSLFVTYGVSSDLFFSGHTALAVYGAIELGRLGPRWLKAVGVVLALFEVITILVLRGHWFMDVFTGAAVAVGAAMLAPRLAPTCDALIARAVGEARRTDTP